MSGRDWAAIRNRLAERVQTRESLVSLFDARARLLAEQGLEGAGRTTRDYLLFRLAAVEYAVPFASVGSVDPLGTIYPVPGSHPAILGVTGRRGQVLPVLDLELVLHPGEAPLRGLCVRLEHAGVELGLAVDAVLGVQAVSEELRTTAEGQLCTALLEAGGATLVDLDLLLRTLGVELA